MAEPAFKRRHRAFLSFPSCPTQQGKRGQSGMGPLSALWLHLAALGHGHGHGQGIPGPFSQPDHPFRAS